MPSIDLAQVILSEDEHHYLYSGNDAHRLSGYRHEPVVAVKHLSPSELFSLEAFIGPARVSLDGFLKRYNNPNQTWMRDQHYYLERAVLAAAYECLFPLFTTCEGLCRLTIDDYDTVRFLKCGRWIKDAGCFFNCGDVCRCPSCNYKYRIEPVQREFLPAFGHKDAPYWYGLGLGATNNPTTSGVHLEIGRDEDGQPIYEHLFLLSEVRSYPRLNRFSLDEIDSVMSLVHCIFDLASWARLKAIFGGVGLVGDIDFSFFPDPARLTGCGHSVMVHAHGIANSKRLISTADAQELYCQFLKMLIKESGGRLPAYPDLFLKPCQDVAGLKKAINYAVKPFKLPHCYIQGLSNGCPVEGLNWEFHQVAWTCEQIFPGANKHLVRFGNLHVNSPDYVGDRQYRKMTRNQVDRFHERNAAGLATAQEIRRYEQHQLACRQALYRRLGIENVQLGSLNESEVI